MVRVSSETNPSDDPSRSRDLRKPATRPDWAKHFSEDPDYDATDSDDNTDDDRNNEDSFSSLDESIGYDGGVKSSLPSLILLYYLLLPTILSRALI